MLPFHLRPVDEPEPAPRRATVQMHARLFSVARVPRVVVGGLFCSISAGLRLHPVVQFAHPLHGKGSHQRNPALPPSKWIDVASGAAQGHWIPDEGRQLDRILHTLADLEFGMSQGLVIGPFRDIAREVSSRPRRYPDLVAGTVHTAQGKQADVVILVLGSNPDKHGARKWASSKPNLLNVAVSRAKRRLYVIGNHQLWSDQRYFKTLTAKLPHTTPFSQPADQ